MALLINKEINSSSEHGFPIIRETILIEETTHNKDIYWQLHASKKRVLQT